MKRNRIRRLAMFAVVSIVFASVLAGCSGEEKPTPKVMEDIYVFDVDNVVDNQAEQKLNSMLTDLKEETNVEFMVMTTESLLGYSIEEQAANLFQTLGISPNGVLFLISKTDDKVRLEVGKGLEEILDASKCTQILDKHFMEYSQQEEYSEATDNTVRTVVKTIADEYEVYIAGVEEDSHVDSEDTEKEQSRENDNRGWVIIAMAIMGILSILMCIDCWLLGDRVMMIVAVIFLLLVSLSISALLTK